MIPDLNRLEVFYYVFRFRSVQQAARQLHVTQSAVSQQLKNLEAELETTLFSRVSKRLIPTAAAQTLYKTVEPFLEELAQSVHYIHHAKEEPFGTLRIAAPVVFGSRFLVKQIAKFSHKYPNVTFQLTLGRIHASMHLLLNNDVDFVFADGFLDHARSPSEQILFESEIAFVEKMLLVGSKEYYKRCIGARASYKALTQCNYIEYQQHLPLLKGWYKHHYKKLPPALRVVLTVESVAAVADAVRAGLGLGFIPSYTIESELRSKSLIPIKTPKKDSINKVSLVRLKGASSSMAERLFIDFFHFQTKSMTFADGLQLRHG